MAKSDLPFGSEFTPNRKELATENAGQTALALEKLPIRIVSALGLHSTSCELDDRADGVSEPASIATVFQSRRLVFSEAARPLVRRWAIMAEAARDPRLKKRTPTNLYSERPTWLRLAHEQLDRAVLAAYAATDLAGGWSEDWAALWSETSAGQPLPTEHPLAARRAGVNQAVLANLLRLKGTRD